MRTITKPSTANCTLSMYISFLLADPKNATCTRLSEVMEDISHESVTRFLHRENYTQEDLFNEVKSYINLKDGTLSGDDSVLDKPYSDPTKSPLLGYYWSGKHKRAVLGINYITLYYTDINDVSVPINYRIYDKQDGKTKNDYLREMINEVMDWGLKPGFLTGDSWYASLENLQLVRHHKLGFLFAIKNNRLVSLVEGSKYCQVQRLEIPDDGLVVHLKGFGQVKVFRKVFKNEFRYYIMYLTDQNALKKISRIDIKQVHDNHWGIESYHRAAKQVCNIEKFQVRTHSAIKTHIFAAILAFVKLELMRNAASISNWYEIRKNLFNDVIRSVMNSEVTESI